MSNDAARKQIRGSGLLLSGRFLSLGINLLTQVLIVRYLSKSDYGLFAYTLALISAVTILNSFGMDRTISRFIPVYEEQRDLPSAAGALIFALGAIAALGLAFVGLVIGFRSLLTDYLIENPDVIQLLVVMIALAPVDAFDKVLQSTFSVFGQAKIIFIRKYVLGPCLKLTAIFLTIAASGDVRTLAIAHLLAGAAGLSLYGVVLPKVLREKNLAQYFQPGKFSIKYRQLTHFSMPIYIADIAVALRLTVVVVILEYFHDLSNVAEYRAVLPIASLNGVVLVSFSLLFLPMASRLFVQKNAELLREVQSHMALWVMVLTFPLFAVCISLAKPLIVLLIGERYSASAPVLAIMATGHFFQAALGLNRQTLSALGRARVLLYIEILAMLTVSIAALVLVPKFGAIGGAVATASTMIFYSCMNTFMLWRISGNSPLPWAHVKVYLLAAVCALGLWLVKPMLGVDSFLVSLLLAGLTSLVVLAACWNLLHVDEIFPELKRLLQSIKRLFGGTS